jgi:hypothetical protein
MSTNSPRASIDRQILRAFAERLITLAREITRPPLSYDENDHLRFMMLCFVSKQMEHLRSVCLLVDAGRDRDAGLIARAMVEGLGLLLWAAREPAIRPLQWRRYAWVEDWRLVRQREQSGEPIDPSRKSHIEQQLKVLGPIMYSAQARKSLHAGKLLPADPYMRWSDIRVREVLNEVCGIRLYETVYHDTSAWSHWNVAAIGRAIERNENRVRYSEASPETAATALAIGFQALFESASLLDQHFARGFADRLVELRDAYFAQLGTGVV